ncbi:MAG: hypothetical protein JXB26_17980 [Candidatus Aminicenantes bacterium]|nr:hypothetical protein [Candidatus Aminicenantes bacterium]
MSDLIDWIIGMEAHELILWLLVIALLIWEFIIKRKSRISSEREISELKSELMKLGFDTEISKKDLKEEIRDLYQKYSLTEQEIEKIKQRTFEGTSMGKYLQPTSGARLEVNNRHIFVLKLLENSDDKRALADFILAYYQDVFEDKDKSLYLEIIKQLLDHEMIEFLSINQKRYLKISQKGHDFLKTVESLD